MLLLRLLRFERRWLVRVFEELLPRGADARLSMGATGVPMDRFVDVLRTHASLEFVVGLRFCRRLDSDVGRRKRADSLLEMQRLSRAVRSSPSSRTSIRIRFSSPEAVSIGSSRPTKPRPFQR